MVLLPEPDTPITISAQGDLRDSSVTGFPSYRAPIHQQNCFFDGSRAIYRQVLACQEPRQDRVFLLARDLEKHLAAGSEHGNGKGDPWHKGLDGSLCDADGPAPDFLESGIVREE